MASTMLFRSSSTRFVGVGAIAFSAVGLASLVVEREWDDLARFGGLLGLVALTGYAVMWLPYVEVSEGGLAFRNVFRTVRLPWPAIEEVDGRYGLRVQTAYGRFTAWAAPAPAGRDRMRGGDSEAAALVRRQMERLQGLGHLDNRRLESDHADVTWHVPVIIVAVALVVLTAAGPMLS
jgi:hypothetical protein